MATIIKLVIFVIYGACWVCLCCHNPLTSDMDYMIFIMHTDVNACDCARGCSDTVREPALRADSGRKIPCRNGESNLRQRRAGPKLNQLSYIPTLHPNIPFSHALFLRPYELSQKIPQTNRPKSRHSTPLPTRTSSSRQVHA